MVARALTQKEIDVANAIFARANKPIGQAYDADPRTQVAKALMTNGLDTSEAKGGYAEGIGRVLSGLAGGYIGKQQSDKYRNADNLASAEDEAALIQQRNPSLARIGQTAPAPAPVAPPPGPTSPIAAPEPAGLVNPNAAPPSPQAVGQVASSLLAPQPQGQEAMPGAQPPFPQAIPAIGGLQSASLGRNNTAPTPLGPGQTLNPRRPGTVGAAGPARVPRGQRAVALDGNNPGGLNDGRFAAKQPGYVGNNGRYAAFDTVENGLNAQRNLLKSYVDRGYNTPLSIAKRWAPAEDGNNPGSYANNIARQMGIGVNDRVTPDMINNFSLAQAKAENVKFGGSGGSGTYARPGGNIEDTGNIGSPGSSQPANIPTAPRVAEAAMPSEPEPVARPTLAKQVSSSRMEIVDNLLNNTENSQLSPSLRKIVRDQYLDKGLTEEQANKTAAAEAENDLTKIGYTADLGLRNTKSGQINQGLVDEYGKSREFNRDMQGKQYEAETGAARDATTNDYTVNRENTQRGFEHNESILAYDREWALQEKRLDAAKATAKEKAEARMDLWIGTSQGQKAAEKGRAGSEAASSMLGYLDQFASAYDNLTQGGAQGFGTVQQITGSLTGNENVGVANNASQRMASMLGEELKGSMSEGDRDWLVGAVPSLSKSRKYNEGTLQAMRRVAERQQEFWRLYNKSIGDGGPAAAQEFQSKWDEYIGKVSLNPASTKNYVTYEQYTDRDVRR